MAPANESALAGSNRLLLALEDTIRPLFDAHEITQAAARLLGEYLRVNRCAYADVEDDEDTFNLTGDYNRDVPSIVGRYRFAQFGEECLRLMRAGQPYVVEDSETDPRTTAVRASYRATLIRSVICVSVVKAGRFVAAMAVHQTTARRWAPDEIELVQGFANRCWESIERQQAEQRLRASLVAERQAREEAERASRMKDEFLATISHELRTPLNAIVGWANLLSESRDDPQMMKEGLEVIERNAEAQAQLIDDLLDVARITTGKLRLSPTNLDLCEVIEAAVSTVQMAATSKGITLRIGCAGPVRVVGDRDRLQQVFWNLLANAIKFTERGGSVSVDCETRGSAAVVTVEDTGRGIEPEFLPHVFDRFRQADMKTTRRAAGLGLGLSIVRHLVEMHGGSVSAESEGLGKGSTFRVEIPNAVGAPEDDAMPARPATEGTVARKTVSRVRGQRALVIDDERDARRVIQATLARHGVEVVAVGTASDAIGVISSGAKIDVVISDIGMPDEDGYAFLRRLRELEQLRRRSPLPVVALTAFARQQDRNAALQAGFDAFLTKPVRAGELLDLLESLLPRKG
ncbi:MAG TPA: ATP-binding protein [Opitutus sp.]|nr:ATP-binding protein [Opitutus sp.]